MADNLEVSFDNIMTADYTDPLSILLPANELLFAVINEEVQSFGMTRQELGEQLSVKIKNIVEQYRKERQTKEIIKGGVMFGIETILLIGILFFTRRLYRRIIKKVDTWVAAKKTFFGKSVSGYCPHR